MMNTATIKYSVEIFKGNLYQRKYESETLNTNYFKLPKQKNKRKMKRG